jgi:plasmid stabilization system protein ParE
MRIVWSTAARSDLRRVHSFLAPKNPRAAAAAMEALTAGPNQLLLQPHIGQRVESISGHEVRRILVGDYEVRYSVVGYDIRLLRIFHTREER